MKLLLRRFQGFFAKSEGKKDPTIVITDTVDVGDRATRGVRALDVVIAGATVYQTADRATDLLTNPGFNTGADDDVRFRGCSAGEQSCPQQSGCEPNFPN